MRTIALAALIALAGCELYTDDSPTATDAGNTCEPTAARNVSCRSICVAEVELCPGAADWTACFEQCRAGEPDAEAPAWCPGQRGAMAR